MNTKLVSLLVMVGLAVGVTAPVFAKKGAKVAHYRPCLGQYTSPERSVGSLLLNQAEADMAHLSFDLYDFAPAEAIKYPELETPVHMPIATDLLEKTDKAIYASFNMIKKHPYMTAAIVLPIIAAGAFSIYLNKTENKQ